MSAATRHRALAGIARTRLLAHLRAADGPMGILELADGVGLHPNTVRDHLRQLVDAGLVVRDVAEPSGRGRPALRFSLAADAADEDPLPYRDLARVLADQLGRRADAVPAATAAGERWGRAAVAGQAPARSDDEALRRVVALLDEHGFAPELPASPSDPIPLRNCPFGTVAVGREPVVCGVHLGLMRGALREIGSDLDARRLEPFVRPDLCVAHLGRRDADA